MTAENLVEGLKLERLELNLFRGVTPRTRPGRVYGGQVIAQSLLAAYETVEGRLCHSLHAYFIRPGDPDVPIVFEVDRSRDGGSFTTRRVIAVQNGKQIFNLAASFHVQEDGLEHQATAPPHLNWRDLVTDEVHDTAAAEGRSDFAMRYMGLARSVEIRRPPDDGDRTPASYLWFRCRDPIGDDPRLHQVALAFASDMALLSVALRPHGVGWYTPGLQMASLDHAMWFHRPTTFNEWRLYVQDSPAASGGRGFARGMIYDDAGILVASCAQEGLIRIRADGKGQL